MRLGYYITNNDLQKEKKFLKHCKNVISMKTPKNNKKCLKRYVSLISVVYPLDHLHNKEKQKKT